MDERKAGREILKICDLSVSFAQYEKNTFRRRMLPVLAGMEVTVCEGEITAVVGSSGSGKSVLAQAIAGLLPQNACVSGEIRYFGNPIDKGREAALRGREIALIPQGVNSLDPLMKIGKQILNGKKDKASVARMWELFDQYGLEREAGQQFPSELSGGMARRVFLIMARMNHPQLLIADEPTPGMEEALAKKVLADFRYFADAGSGVLLITHDLRQALAVADRVVVFYAGTVVEETSASDFVSEERLRHPYTKALWRAMPEHGFAAEPGAQPPAADRHSGCLFAPRCPYREKVCGGVIPMVPVRGGMTRCVRWKEIEEKTGLQG